MIWLITPLIDAMAATAALVSVWIASILGPSSVTWAVSLARPSEKYVGGGRRRVWRHDLTH